MLYAILIGALCGWLAGNLMKGGGFGIIINILLGVIGGFVGNYLFSKLGVTIAGGWLGDIIRGLTGSVVILFIAGLFKK